MRKSTDSLGTNFMALRVEAGYTMLELSKKAGMSEATVWKIEHDRPVRWETVHALIRVLRITAKTPRYQQFHQQWLNLRQKTAAAKPEGFWKHTLSPHAINATDKFRNLVRDLSPEDTTKVLAAATRSARTLL